MKPVFQDSFGFANGNCAWACTASIFELPLEDFPRPPFSGNQAWFDWTKANKPHLSFNNVDLGYDYDIVDGFPDVPNWGTGRYTYKVREKWEPPDARATGGYWIAIVPSQGLARPAEDAYYPMPALHAVVMLSRECVHNPHPSHTLEPYPKVVAQTWWTPNVPYIEKMCSELGHMEYDGQCARCGVRTENSTETAR